MNVLLQDLRYAIHQLRRAPAFTAVAVLTLALGIGANAAIFSVVNRLLLNPLPFSQADRIVYLRLETAKEHFQLPVADYMASAWQAARTLDGVEAFAAEDLLASDDRGARLVHGTSITPGLTAFLDVRPVLGRAFTADDAKPGAPSVVLLSYGLWQREYGGAEDVLGRSIKLGGTLHTIIGVMPPRLSAIDTADQAADIWLPLDLHPKAESGAGACDGFPNVVDVVARLRPAVPLAQVRSELAGLAMSAMETAGQTSFFGASDVSVRITPPSETSFRSDLRDALLVMSAAVGLVLIVACANVANLLLARGASRAREISLRAALGAGRWRLVRQLMTENLLLALAAGVAGAALGWGTLHVLMRINPGNLSALQNVSLDPFTLLAFTFALSLATGLLFGLVPALHLASKDLGHALRHGGSGVVRGGSGARLRAALVAAEMAVSVVLLVGAGLLVRSVVHLQRGDVGFDTRNLFSVQLSLPRDRYEDRSDAKAIEAAAQRRSVFAGQLLDGIRGLPGVDEATQVHDAPPRYTMSRGLEIRDGTLSDADANAGYPFNYVQPDYFRAMGILVLSGRVFSAAEMASEADHVVMINRTLAQRLWPDGQAVGRRLRTGTNGEGPWLTVIGVVDDALSSGGLTVDRHQAQIYWPYREINVPFTFGAPPGLVFMVRSKSDPAPVIAAIRRAVRALDPEVAIVKVSLTETALAGTLAAPRFNMFLLTAFAVLALVLAAVGLAAVIGYAVAERTHEIGIRMALGAGEGNVLRLVVSQGMRAAVLGVTFGVVVALLATRLLSSMLYGVPPRDPASFVAGGALLLFVALSASWLAARRATRIDPIVALRAE